LEDAKKIIAISWPKMRLSVKKRNASIRRPFRAAQSRTHRIMSGIERLGAPEGVRGKDSLPIFRKLHKLQDTANPDEAKLREISNQVEWSTVSSRIDEEPLRYVCEVPTLIEQRLFHSSRAVQQRWSSEATTRTIAPPLIHARPHTSSLPSMSPKVWYKRAIFDHHSQYLRPSTPHISDLELPVES